MTLLSGKIYCRSNDLKPYLIGDSPAAERLADAATLGSGSLCRAIDASTAKRSTFGPSKVRPALPTCRSPGLPSRRCGWKSSACLLVPFSLINDAQRRFKLTSSGAMIQVLPGITPEPQSATMASKGTKSLQPPEKAGKKGSRQSLGQSDHPPPSSDKAFSSSNLSPRRPLHRARNLTFAGLAGSVAGERDARTIQTGCCTP